MDRTNTIIEFLVGLLHINYGWFIIMLLIYMTHELNYFANVRSIMGWYAMFYKNITIEISFMWYVSGWLKATNTNISVK